MMLAASLEYLLIDFVGGIDDSLRPIIASKCHILTIVVDRVCNISCILIGFSHDWRVGLAEKLWGLHLLVITVVIGHLCRQMNDLMLLNGELMLPLLP